MNILEEILQYKRESLKQTKRVLPLRELKARLKDTPSVKSFKTSVKRDKGMPLKLIAEIKKASPSRNEVDSTESIPTKGVIRKDFNLSDIASIYDKKEGITAISVLTEEQFFQGKLNYLMDVRKITRKPLLRKDFIFDEYQVYESRLSGADAILLIVNCLDKYQLSDLQGLAKELSLDSVIEAHNLKELDIALYSGAELIGVNNRDLNTLKVNLNTTLELLKDIPENKTIISESGIRTRDDVKRLETTRVDAILVGTAFMEAEDIGEKVDELLGM